jgi:2-methylcitrate dehydratase PrpD
VMIAGRGEEPTRLLTEVLKPGPGEATLYFGSRKAVAPDAAWINGVAAHALDFDDVALRGHPSTVLVPAILAEAETLDASGRDMTVAYIAGYEVWAELVRRDAGFHHGKGWHPTGIFGAIAAAAACASLRRLDAGSATRALALGASQSSGLMANFGTMTKPFHAGRSAQSGVMAARLAQAGFTASEDALEHTQGFLSAVSPAGHVNREGVPDRMGERFHIVEQGLNIKKYPTCYCTHRALDGILDLLKEQPVKAEEIDGITVHLSDNYATILRNHLPQTGLAAKFSIEFAMASSVLANRVGLTELTDGFVRRPDIQNLMARVSVVTNTDYDPESPGASVADQAIIRLRSGEAIESEWVARARGHNDKPLSDAELFSKFESCLEVGRSETPAEILFGRFRGMEDGSARRLAALH